MWDHDAAVMLLSSERELEENSSFLDEIFKNMEAKVIVDLGCGSGFYAKKLRQFASVLYCIDSSEEMISVARKGVKDDKLIFLCEDSAKTSLPDSSVDVVFMGNSFHDMDKGKTSAEVARILRSDGSVVVVDWKKEGENMSMRGPPGSMRMTENDYLKWFSGFQVTKRFNVGNQHFGIVMVRIV